MPTRTLPLRPNLAQLKLQANELHQQHRRSSRAAAARIAAHHPRFTGAEETAVLDQNFVLADAQLVVAREYGFDSWPRLKHAVEISETLAQFQPHPQFDAALAAMDNGEAAELRCLLAEHPDLVHARTNIEPPYHYFTGATLLHHVAGNPDRGRFQGTRPPLPANSAEIAKTLLDAGADVNASTIASYGADTMGLVVTSKQASDANVSGPLIDVLLEYGARLDLTSDDCLDPSLANHAPRAAERMIELGARPDLFAAAALGRIDLLRQFFGDDGHLRSVPRRKGKEMAPPDAIGLAMLYAYVREEHAAADFLLEKDGNWDVIGVNNGTALHRAAFKGDLPMVQRLVAKGADVSNRDNPYRSTPLAWADHGNQAAVVDWLRANTAVDLHDAASFAFREHVEARLREKPDSVNTRIDQWDIPQSTALHWAAAIGRLEMASLLLDRGADPELLAGTGMSAKDLAAAQGHADLVALLERRKGTKS